jgi:starvation-inducible DNA-binding protein
MKNSKNRYNSRIGVILLVLCLPLFALAQNKLDYRNEKADERVPLEKDKQTAVAIELQAMTVELIELHHQAKQFHWNIVGPLYLPLHELLDDYDDVYLDYADRVAERLLQIGTHVDGRTETVAKTANLGVVPTGAIPDKQVLDLFSDHVFTVAVRTRQRIVRLSKLDEVSSNLFQELSYKLDKQVWQLRAHQQ